MDDEFRGELPATPLCMVAVPAVRGTGEMGLSPAGYGNDDEAVMKILRRYVNMAAGYTTGW